MNSTVRFLQENVYFARLKNWISFLLENHHFPKKIKKFFYCLFCNIFSKVFMSLSNISLMISRLGFAGYKPCVYFDHHISMGLTIIIQPQQLDPPSLSSCNMFLNLGIQFVVLLYVPSMHFLFLSFGDQTTLPNSWLGLTWAINTFFKILLSMYSYDLCINSNI